MAEVVTASTGALAGPETRGLRRWRRAKTAAPGPAEGAPKPLTRKQAWIRRAPLMPALIYMLVVTQIPFLVTLWYSFRGWNTIIPGSNKWVGLHEYSVVFSDPNFRSAVVNTVIITAASVIIATILATILAVMLNRKFFGRGFLRTLLITPFLVMPIATALLFKTTIFDPIFGLLDWALGPFGVHQVAWLSNQSVASVVATLVWEWTPFMMLIILAGLQSESVESLEAARVDGANALQAFVSITFPHLRRYIQLGGCSDRSTSFRLSVRSTRSPREAAATVRPPPTSRTTSTRWPSSSSTPRKRPRRG